MKITDKLVAVINGAHLDLNYEIDLLEELQNPEEPLQFEETVDEVELEKQALLTLKYNEKLDNVQKAIKAVGLVSGDKPKELLELFSKRFKKQLATLEDVIHERDELVKLASSIVQADNITRFLESQGLTKASVDDIANIRDKVLEEVIEKFQIDKEIVKLTQGE